MGDAAEFLSSWIDDPDAARTAGVDIAFDVDLDAVGISRRAAAEIGKEPFGLFGEQAVGQDIEGPDSAPA